MLNTSTAENRLSTSALWGDLPPATSRLIWTGAAPGGKPGPPQECWCFGDEEGAPQIFSQKASATLNTKCQSKTVQGNLLNLLYLQGLYSPPQYSSPPTSVLILLSGQGHSCREHTISQWAWCNSYILIPLSCIKILEIDLKGAQVHIAHPAPNIYGSILKSWNALGWRDLTLISFQPLGIGRDTFH